VTDRFDIDLLTAEPADVYHARRGEFLSSHALADFRRCPLLFRRKRLGLIPDRDSAAFALGRAAHTLILEGRERFEAEYAVGGPINPRTGKPFGPTTKAFTEWSATIGKDVLSDADAGVVEQMNAVDTSGVEPMAHPLHMAQRLRPDAVTEHDQRERCQTIAPLTEGGLYLVPKVIE